MAKGNKNTIITVLAIVAIIAVLIMIIRPYLTGKAIARAGAGGGAALASGCQNLDNSYTSCSGEKICLCNSPPIFRNAPEDAPCPAGCIDGKLNRDTMCSFATTQTPDPDNCHTGCQDLGIRITTTSTNPPLVAQQKKYEVVILD